MTIKLGVVMDPIATIHFKKDSTLALLLAAQRRHYQLYYFEPKNLFLLNGVPYGDAHLLEVFEDPQQWFKLKETVRLPLKELNVMLMRKDPPFDEAYLHTTYLLDYVARAGVLVVNRPQSLRDANEKIFASLFPQCSPQTLVTQNVEQLWEFLIQHHDIVCKPLNAMGGASVFRLQKGDANVLTVFDLLTHSGARFVMAQQFIPEIKQGDKRILLINGEPLPYVLARVPQGRDWRGNLAVGAKGEIRPLSARDTWICEQIGPTLRERGLYFVGIDIIGDYLTEINVTSPTGIREIYAETGVDASQLLLDCIEKQLV